MPNCKSLKRFLCLFFLSFGSVIDVALAQNSITPDVVNSNGGSYTYEGITFEWSVGELALIETLFEDQVRSNPSITSGFLQPMKAGTVVAMASVNASNIITLKIDGKNDTWKIENLNLYPDNEVTVFDRMGRTVFHTTNYLNDWGGTYGGSTLPEDTYYYIIKLKVNGQISYKKGFITVIRE
ncbi:MAG: gliding motility-associated C-terminal domain-containing protein [Sphingobacteriaceae bacterium]